MLATFLAAAIAISLLPGLSKPVHAAQSEIYDLDVDLQSKVAREKVKQRGPRRGSGEDKGGNSDNCGQVDIGNNDGSNNSARGRINPRGQTVIVTGPVINAARCR